MNYHRRIRFGAGSTASLAIAATLALLPCAAEAQDAATGTTQSTDQAAPAPEPAADQSDIVIVGTAGEGTRRQSAAYAVTTLDSKALNQLAPASTAEVLRLVPGVSTESSGGQNGANIFVRGYPSGGDAEYVTFQSEGVPIFPPSTLSFLENSQLIRIDDTVRRVEAVRGGTGALFSSGQPGLTVNVVQREGGQDFEGEIKPSVTTFGTLRADGYVSGPIDPNTTFMVGGYFATGSGLRDPGFNAEKGGQVTANIRHDFGRGSLLLFGRYLNDRGQWLLTAPVVQNGNKISAYPGFDARNQTLAGPETEHLTLGDGTRSNLSNGRGAKIGNIGGNFDYELTDNLKLRERANWLHGSANTVGLVPGSAAPMTASAYAAGLGSTVGSLTFANGGATVSPDQTVLTAGLWTVDKKIDSFVNDLALEFKSGINKLTAGFYYAGYSSKDVWNLGNNVLLTATPNARLLDLTLADGRVVSSGGIAGGSTFRVNARYTGRDYAFYAVDELQLTDKLRVDGGIRYQHHRVTGTLEDLTTTGAAGLDGNPDTLYDNNASVLAGTFTALPTYSKDKWSWTAGANYDFTPSVGVFVRYSRGNSFPAFDNLRDGVTDAPQVDTYEGGVKVTTDLLRVYATVYHNNFSGLTSSVITTGAPIISVGGARATGAELEGRFTPVRNFSINFSAAWLDAKYRDFITPNPNYNAGLPISSTNPAELDLTGYQVQRQPRWQWRVGPSYQADFGETKATLYTAIAYVGDRYSDVTNFQLLPHYYKWDAGVTVDVDRHFTIQASVDNITNSIGLTEGNVRNLGSQGSGAILARSILGRSALFSVAYKF